MKTLIKNGKIINPLGYSGSGDILIENGSVSQIGNEINADGAYIVDAEGRLVFPGLVDMHCHLREPGYEYKEDIKSGTRAAAAGGFTSVACMPNTNPVCDNESVVAYITRKAAKAGSAKVYPIAAITKNLEGAELSEMGYLIEAGAVAFSDDGRPVQSSLMMRNALLYAKSFGALIISHCEDLELVDGGVMNEGFSSSKAGLRGITRAAEETMIARELLLADALDTKVHIAHVSTAGGVELIRNAKKKGIKVTCETCPHYFSATDEECLSYNTNAKINPPLRTKEDIEAIKQGLADGTIDAIATDHAPHHIDDKNVEFDVAANGTTGFETALALSWKLVEKGVLSPEELIRKLSSNPAAILKIPGGVIKQGCAADITIFDPKKEWTVQPEKLYTKGKNTLFAGWKLTGRATDVFVDGRHIIKNCEAVL